ncbi:hypothetical protein Lal_00028314 [Lupinus albus]|nr:hypothetical protein Lal_00028314 [Lupinus albus]
MQTPSHVLHFDDILIFYKGVKRELLYVKQLIMEYAQAFGQQINQTKCKFYTCKAAARKIGSIASFLGFSVGWIRNFIWVGDTRKKKLFTVAWIKVYSPMGVGGLGLRSLKLMNKAALLKLTWEMRFSN